MGTRPHKSGAAPNVPVFGIFSVKASSRYRSCALFVDNFPRSRRERDSTSSSLSSSIFFPVIFPIFFPMVFPILISIFFPDFLDLFNPVSHMVPSRLFVAFIAVGAAQWVHDRLLLAQFALKADPQQQIISNVWFMIISPVWGQKLFELERRGRPHLVFHSLPHSFRRAHLELNSGIETESISTRRL